MFIKNKIQKSKDLNIKIYTRTILERNIRQKYFIYVIGREYDLFKQDMLFKAINEQFDK